MDSNTVGGGVKKVLYTLQTLQRIGIKRSAKALSSKNACKACAYGMGGQMGGMTNEQGEFPSVCNKSVQAQSTDIQPAIPIEVFDHTLDDLRELSPHELEHIGRLANPILKRAGDDRYRVIDWDDALHLAAQQLGETDPARTFFYSSGRSSNEAGFLFQLLARAWGTNNVNNCSYYCHQATSVALGATIGTGTATVELADLDRCDLIFVIGANPASNHPRFIHKLKACRDRGGHVVMINPAREAGLVKFAVPKSPGSLLLGGTEIASAYLQPNVGEDIALFKGIAKAIIESGRHDAAFIEASADGFEAFLTDIRETDWSLIEQRAGIAREKITAVADLYAGSRDTVFAWGMGMTHHRHGSENIEYIANLALLRGMIGKPGRGLLPLRGHSNVQGIGTIGVKPVLPEDVFQKLQQHFGVTLPTAAGWDTMAAMQAAHAGDVDAAVLMGGNLYASNPNSRWAGEALDRIGFRVCLTTTLNQSHLHGVDGDVLVLPVSARDEEWEPTTQESMFNFVRLSDGQIIRHANVRPEVVILADLATRLMPDSPIDFQSFKQHRRLREAIAATVPGLEQLADIDVARREFHIGQRLMHTPEFRTATGRAVFQVRALPDVAGDSEHDFSLTTVRSEGQFNSIIYEEKDSYRKTDTRWCVMLNARDIDELGIKPGVRITLESAHGRMADVKVFVHDLPPGNAMAYYPEANCLTGTDVDPRSKTPSFKHTRVRLIQAT
ncbi:MAG: FdhF/YdeP family oxidoreductase, partial [Pseudomonadota bacterium]